jgi:hypothetical protein
MESEASGQATQPAISNLHPSSPGSVCQAQGFKALCIFVQAGIDQIISQPADQVP